MNRFALKLSLVHVVGALALFLSAREAWSNPLPESSDPPAVATEPFGVQRPRPGGDLPGITGGTGDGVYDRFDGDLSYSLGLALEASLSDASYRLGPTIGLRYYQTVGVRAAWLLSPEGTAPLGQALILGLMVEPLFLLRFATDHASGQAFWDLTIDSVGLSTDLVVLTPQGNDSEAQTAFDLGLGAGLPLFARAKGPFLRFRGKARLGPAQPEALGELSLEWQGFFESPWLKE